MATARRRKECAARSGLGTMKLADMSAPMRRAIILAATAVASAAGAAATESEAALPVIGRLERGLWDLRNMKTGGRFAPVCLRNPAALVQLQHRRSACTHNVVAHAANRLEVSYRCPTGFGQTTIRVETSRLVRIESEGIDNGVPFGFRAEGRRVGPC
jgi:hypothetical protein